MGATCSVGHGARCEKEQTTVPRERNLPQRKIKVREAPMKIKRSTPSRSSLAEQKPRDTLQPRDTLAAKEIGMSIKSYSRKSHALFPFSSSNANQPTEVSMSSFDWAANGCGCDGIDLKLVTREEIGLKTLKAMEACGVDVKTLSTHGGRSALMFAVISEDLGFVKKLVARGADVLEENERGETALGLAKSLSTDDIYNFLLKSTGDAVN